jgi:hypothetical protein
MIIAFLKIVHKNFTDEQNTIYLSIFFIIENTKSDNNFDNTHLFENKIFELS